MARSKKTSGSTAPHFWNAPGVRAKAAWVAASVGTLALLLALGSFHHADWPSKAVAVHNEPAANLLGNAGAALAYWTYAIFGFGTWLAVLLGAAALAAMPFGFRPQHLWLRAIGAGILVLAVGAIHALWFPRLGPVAGVEAGLIPQWAAAELAARFSGFATSVILLCAAVVGAVVAADEVVFRIPGAVIQGLGFLEPVWKYDWAGFFATLTGKRRSSTAVALAGVGANASPALRRARGSRVTVVDEEDEDGADNVTVVDAAEEAEDEDAVDAEDVDDDSEEDEDEEPEAEAADDEDSERDSDVQPARAALSNAELHARISKLPVRMAGAAKKTALRDEDIPRTVDYTGYRFPGLEMLSEPVSGASDERESFVRDQAARLTAALREYD
ncbi:MAG: DNA translocase FtsK 4TM domain-containing protein, partial [Planctomycetota bacterium]